MDGEPEDWPAEPSELRLLDRALRCGICFDLYTGPVALSCGHSFCSRCIRDAFNVRVRDGQPAVCPSCRTPVDQADLRPVVHLREASSAWRAVRQLLLSQHLQAVLLLQQAQAAPQQAQPLPPPLRHEHQRQQRQVPSQQQQQQHPPALTPARPPGKHAIRSAPAAVARAPPDADACITISSSGAAGDDARGAAGASEVADTADSWDAGDSDDAADGDDQRDPDWDAGACQQQQQHNAAGARSSGGPLDRRRQRSSSATGSSGGGGGCPRKRSSSGSRDGGGADACGADSEAGSHGCVAPGQAATGCSDGDDDGGDFQCMQQQQPKRPRPAVAPSTGKENKARLQLVEQQPAAVQGAMQPPHSKQQQHTPPPPPPPPPGYVACPICGLSVRAAFINSHVDSCLARSQAAELAGGPQHQQAPQQPQQQAQPQRRGGGGGAAAASAHPGAPAQVPAALRGKRAAAAPLEAPPKLCFALLKERELKAKLAALGLGSDGSKNDCVERYCAFRNYVLSLKDSGSAASLQQAAAVFNKQQRSVARAASRQQALLEPGGAGGLAALGGASVAAAAAVSGTEGGLLAGADNSFAALIQQTRARMQRKAPAASEPAGEAAAAGAAELPQQQQQQALQVGGGGVQQ